MDPYLFIVFFTLVGVIFFVPWAVDRIFDAGAQLLESAARGLRRRTRLTKQGRVDDLDQHSAPPRQQDTLGDDALHALPATVEARAYDTAADRHDSSASAELQRLTRAVETISARRDELLNVRLAMLIDNATFAAKDRKLAGSEKALRARIAELTAQCAGAGAADGADTAA